MLVKVSRQDKSKSIYQCDRCKAKTTNGRAEIYDLYIREPYDLHPRKRWHLCRRCFRLLEKTMEKAAQ